MAEGFTKIKSMSFPREIIAGHNAIEKLGELCLKFELSGKALIVTGVNTNRAFGRQVQSVLDKNLIPFEKVILGEASRACINRCELAIKERNISFLIALGGGSKIDIAKMAAAELRLPFISVPTTASHDGISSPRASIKDSNTVFSAEATMPLAIVADTSIIARSPFRFLASGCADVIANLTAIKDWELAVKLKHETFSRTAFTMSKMAAETIIENAGHVKPGLEESVWLVIRQIITSGLSMGVAGSSRPTSGSEHLFSHALDMVAPGKALHGEQCGVGAIMMMYLHGGDWQKIRDALGKLGAPTNAKGLRVAEDKIIRALTMAHKVRPDRYTILGDSGLSKSAAHRLARETGVI